MSGADCQIKIWRADRGDAVCLPEIHRPPVNVRFPPKIPLQQETDPREESSGGYIRGYLKRGGYIPGCEYVWYHLAGEIQSLYNKKWLEERWYE